MTPNEVAPGVFVTTSTVFLTTTTVVAGRDGGCLLIDPALTVAELAGLGEWLASSGLRPVVGWATHAHWDHVLWAASLGRGVPRYATFQTVEAVAGRRQALIAEMAADAPGHDLDLFGRLQALGGSGGSPSRGALGGSGGSPSQGALGGSGGSPSRGAPRPEVIPWDGPEARVVWHDAHAPGHGALFLAAAGVLIAGDMLSDVEIPLLDLESADPFGSYRAGLGTLARLPGVRLAVPGHGHVADAGAVRRRIAADFGYLDAVEACRDVADRRLLPADAGWLRAEHARHLEAARVTATERTVLLASTVLLVRNALKDEDRDKTVGLLLVLGVRRVGRDGPRPPLFPLRAAHLADGHVPLDGAVLHLNVRVGPHVVHPLRVLRRAALGADDGVRALVLHSHQRSLAHLAALRPEVGDHNDRQARVEQCRARTAAGALILLDLVPDPRRRACLVLSVNWHVPS
jgi:hydroxyacylglutathione hydrolase